MHSSSRSKRSAAINSGRSARTRPPRSRRRPLSIEETPISIEGSSSEEAVGLIPQLRPITLMTIGDTSLLFINGTLAPPATAEDFFRAMLRAGPCAVRVWSSNNLDDLVSGCPSLVELMMRYAKRQDEAKEAARRAEGATSAPETMPPIILDEAEPPSRRI